MKKTIFLLLLLPIVSGAQIITTVVGPNSLVGCGEFLTMDHAGNFYFPYGCNEGIGKVDTAGMASQICGTGAYGFSGDGGPATDAELYDPMGITVDELGNVYIADMNNERVRKISTSGIITTIAGMSGIVAGVGGFSGDGGLATAAQFSQPANVFIDHTGNIFVCDADNGRIRKINAAGIVTTVAGGGTSLWGDGGPATDAMMSEPIALAFDAAGNMYICDGYGGYRIRKVNTAGIISTVAGTGNAGYNGDGIPATNAEINDPIGMAVDPAGNIYIADTYNDRIRRVDLDGFITTIAGTGVPGFSGDGGPAPKAQVKGCNLWIDSTGNVYVIDHGNSRIRLINNHIHIPYFSKGSSETIYDCDDTIAINTYLSVSDLDTATSLTWSLLSSPRHGIANASYTGSTDGRIVMPTGLTYIRDTGYTGYDTLQVMVTDGSMSDTITLYTDCYPDKAPDLINSSEKTTLYPNPATEAITIEATQNIHSVSVENVVGQQVFTHEYEMRTVRIDVSHLPPGIYFARINGCDIRKFIKK